MRSHPQTVGGGVDPAFLPFALLCASLLLLACSPAMGAEPAIAEKKELPDQAELFFRAGQYEKALPLYQERLAAAHDAETAGQIMFQIGQSLTGMKRYLEAVAAFENVAVKFPTSSVADRAFLRKGAVQAGLLHEPVKGIATWQEMLRKYPKSELSDEARFYIGIIQWITGQKSQARESWRVLIHDFPESPRSAQAQSYLEEKRT